MCDKDMNSYRNQRIREARDVTHIPKKQTNIKKLPETTELGNFYKLNFTSIRERKRTLEDLKYEQRCVALGEDIFWG